MSLEMLKSNQNYAKNLQIIVSTICSERLQRYFCILKDPATIVKPSWILLLTNLEDKTAKFEKIGQ